MSRKEVLTDAQKQIIIDNIDLFPAQIKQIPGMEGSQITRSIIANYQKRAKIEKEPDAKKELADALQRYMDLHGLPSRFHGKNNVTGFLGFLRQ